MGSLTFLVVLIQVLIFYILDALASGLLLTRVCLIHSILGQIRTKRKDPNLGIL